MSTVGVVPSAAQSSDGRQAGSRTQNPTDADKQAAQEDIEAQKNMVHWSFVAALAAAISAFFAGLGVLLLWRTLLATKAAAISAKDMVVEAQATTAAATDTLVEARRANEIANKGLIAQHRPWIVIGVNDDNADGGPATVHVSEGGNVEVSCHITMKNIGNSPATMVFCEMQPFWTSGAWPTQEELLHVVELAKLRAPSMSKFAEFIPLGGTNKMAFAQLKAKSASHKGARPKPDDEFTIVVACAVIYKSMLSDEWLHTACFVIIRRKLSEGMHPSNRKRFTRSDYEVGPDQLEAFASRSGWSISVT